MRSELDRMNASVAHAEIELERLRAETEQLRGIVQSNSASLQNTERDIRLLLQTFAAPIAQNSR
jgi:multidrug resistance efflux pump